MIYYLFVIVLILFILAIVYLLLTSTKPKTTNLADLQKMLQKICEKASMNPEFELFETTHITYTEKLGIGKGNIHLVLWDTRFNQPFQFNTIIYAGLHELAHILSPSSKHKPPFDSIEKTLLETATKLGYYDSEIPIEAHYVTAEE